MSPPLIRSCPLPSPREFHEFGSEIIVYKSINIIRQYRVRRFFTFRYRFAQQPRVVVRHVLFLRAGYGVVVLHYSHRLAERRDFRLVFGARQTLYGQLFARL